MSDEASLHRRKLSIQNESSHDSRSSSQSSQSPSKRDGDNECSDLLLDRVERILPKYTDSLFPLFLVLKFLFGLSILLYGMEFRTIAFHIIVFRISGYKNVTENWGELMQHYKKVRATAKIAAKNTKSLNEQLAMKEKLKEELSAMLKDRKILLRDGIVTSNEMEKFLKKHGKMIQKIAENKDRMDATKSSITALRTAVPWKNVASTIKDLYAALITSITASTYKFAGKLSLAVYCGTVLYEDVLLLIGPYIDPLGFEHELKSYIIDILQTPAKNFATVAGVLSSIGLFFCLYLEPETGLQVALCFLGSNVILDILLNVANSLIRMRYKCESPGGTFQKSPTYVLLHIIVTAIGFRFHCHHFPAFKAVCMPFIFLLQELNRKLSHYNMSAVNFFQREGDQDIVAELIEQAKMKR